MGSEWAAGSHYVLPGDAALLTADLGECLPAPYQVAGSYDTEVAFSESRQNAAGIFTVGVTEFPSTNSAGRAHQVSISREYQECIRATVEAVAADEGGSFTVGAPTVSPEMGGTLLLFPISGDVSGTYAVWSQPAGRLMLEVQGIGASSSSDAFGTEMARIINALQQRTERPFLVRILGR